MRRSILAAALFFLPVTADAQVAVWSVPQPASAAVATAGGAPAKLGSGAAPAVLATAHPPLYLPVNNLDPRASFLAGVMTGGSLAGAGRTVRVNMTTAGGKPTNGAPVWIASATDDGASQFTFSDQLPSLSAAGKFTATKPDLTMPAYPVLRQNLAPAGIVVDNSSYDIDQTVTVTLAGSGGVSFVDSSGDSTNTPDTEAIFHAVKGVIFGASPASYSTDGTTSEKKLAVGQTYVFTFVIDNLTSAQALNASGWRSFNAGTGFGWRMDVYDPGSSARFISIEAGGSHEPVVNGALLPGVNMVAVTRPGDNLFHICTNGQTVGTVTDTGADAVSGQTLTMDFSWGGSTGIVKLNRSMTDTELQNVTSKTVGTWFDEGLNPYAPDATLVADPACQWYTDASTFTGGTLHAIAGAAGTSFDWTANGSPIRRDWTEHWFHDPTLFFQDGDGPVLDSRHSMRSTPFARMRFTTVNMWEAALIRLGLVSEDIDNNDEAAVTLFLWDSAVSNLPVCSNFVGADGSLDFNPLCYGRAPVATASWQTGGVGPYRWDLVVGDMLVRIHTLATGDYFNRIDLVTSVTETPPGTTRATSVVEGGDFGTSRRIVLVGSGESLGGHSRDLIGESPISGAPCSRMRATFPGKITCEVYAATSLDRVVGWGVAAYAQRLVDLTKQGHPNGRLLVFNYGFQDWNQGHPQSNAAATAMRYGQTLDAVHADDPMLAIDVVLPIQTGAFSSTNSNGETLQQFVTAIEVVVAARPWITLIDASGPTTIVFDITNEYPSAPAGQIAVANNFRSHIGW